MNLALRVDEDSTEEKDEASDGEDKGCYELEVHFHNSKLWMSESNSDAMEKVHFSRLTMQR